MCSSSSKDMIAPKSCFSFHKILFLNFFPSSYTVTDSDRWPVGMDTILPLAQQGQSRAHEKVEKKIGVSSMSGQCCHARARCVEQGGGSYTTL